MKTLLLRIIRSAVFQGVELECLECFDTTRWMGTRLTPARRAAILKHGCTNCRERLKRTENASPL